MQWLTNMNLVLATGWSAIQSLRNWKIPRILFADGVTFPVSKWRTEAVSAAELSSLSTPSLIAPTDSKRGSGGLEAQMHR